MFLNRDIVASDLKKHVGISRRLGWTALAMVVLLLVLTFLHQFVGMSQEALSTIEEFGGCIVL